MHSPIHGGDPSIAASTFACGTIGWGTKSRDSAIDALYDAYREAGGNFFDSAHIYAAWLPDGAGASERALGEIVRRRGDRDRVILATKGGHPPVEPWYPKPAAYLSAEVIARDIDESLSRLGVESIDLYFLHRDDPRVPVSEIIDMLNAQIAKRRIRQLGASNWTTARIDLANQYAIANQHTGFVASQPKYSLGVPKPSSDPAVQALSAGDEAWHATIGNRQGVTVCAYTPSASGFFATNGQRGAGGWDTPTSRARLRAVNQIAGEIGASPNQVAMAYLLHRPFKVIPILGTADPAHLRDALGAARVALSAEQIRALKIDGESGK